MTIGKWLAPLSAGFLCAALCSSTLAQTNGDWTTYGHDKGGQRFPPLTQITPDNAANLKPVWVYHMKPATIAWQVLLGVTDSLPEDKQNTGRPNIGGSIVTAGGVVFIAATDDSRFRAFDAKTGKLLWTVKLEAAGHATPMTIWARTANNMS